MLRIFFYPADDMAVMASLIIYTIVGLIAYFAGLNGNDLARRTYGIVLLSFVVVRLIFIDVWGMELFGRVVTFLAIGVLLMSTAFVTKKKKHEGASVPINPVTPAPVSPPAPDAHPPFHI